MESKIRTCFYSVHTIKNAAAKSTKFRKILQTSKMPPAIMKVICCSFFTVQFTYYKFRIWLASLKKNLNRYLSAVTFHGI